MYLDWEENQDQDYIAIDIETDGLDASTIWVMCWENIRNGNTGTCRGVEEVRLFFDEHPDCIFVGHNIVKFDAPVVNRLADAGIKVNRVVDTLILTTLYKPTIQGGHSLAAWGERVGYEKLEYDDWSRLTKEMVTYCQRDVKVTVELFKRITRVLNKIGFSELSCQIQHKITHISNIQQKNGFKFNGEKAIQFLQELRAEEERLKEEIYTAFPPVVQELSHYKQAYKKDGTHTAGFLKHKEQFEKVEIQSDGSYKVFGPVAFNLGSPAQRTKKLVDLGWKPRKDEETKTGLPRPFISGSLAPSLEEFLEDHDVPEVRLIAKWMTINGRANMVNTWLENWNEETGNIHGKLFVADTLRFRHQAPNTANVPAVRADKRGALLLGQDGDYTYEARDLWCARQGRVLVGTDAAGLELRMLAHYLNRPDFTKGVVEGDPHQSNADIVGITRPEAKTLIYAVCYGAGPPKIAATLKVPVREGARIRTLFLERLGLKELIDECQHEQESGRVWLVDGSGVVCPSPHAALNYKLQGGGARVMALGSIFLEGYIHRHGLDSLKVGDIHDEWQYDVAPEDAREHARLSVQAIRDAGEHLNLNVPLDGEAKEGLTWAETH